ncbi:MAG TPA: GNAT family N-acetyltransferase, partial [Tepidisphaeraceae bacterium]|nr:GNAT family N-acetyltransferase [Tepidisphaeraceae bacterium]
MSMKINVIRGSELSDEQLRQWQALQEANPALHSPYFCPHFTQAVAAVRRDVQVAVMEDGNRIVGFFPFQRTAMGMGRPVGGALSDFQALIALPDAQWDAQELIRKCGLSLWDFDHLLACQTPFAAYHRATDSSPYIDLAGGYESYARARRDDGSEQIKKAGNLRRKMERELGPLEFAAHTSDEAAFQQLLKWKSQQYISSGTTDVFSYGWTVALLRRLVEIQTADFAGMLSVLSVNGRVVAAHLGMRSKTTWHYWFPSYDHEFAKFSPGLLLLLKMAESAPAIGINRFDLGKGESQYKNR